MTDTQIVIVVSGALALLGLLTVLYMKALARNVERRWHYREKFYDAADKLIDAPDDLVPNETLFILGAMDHVMRSRVSLPRILVITLAQTLRLLPKPNQGNMVETYGRRMPPELQKVFEEAAQAAAAAIVHNGVLGGWLTRKLFPRRKNGVSRQTVMRSILASSHKKTSHHAPA